MAAFLAVANTINTLGRVAMVIGAFEEVLREAGIDPKEIARIVGELIKKLRGGKSERGDGAPLSTPWEYSVITLSEKRSWGRTKGLVPTLRDSVQIPPTDLATYLNQVSAKGWEVLLSIGGQKALILILIRPRLAT